jgi:hypothetical protein
LFINATGQQGQTDGQQQRFVQNGGFQNYRLGHVLVWIECADVLWQRHFSRFVPFNNPSCCLENAINPVIAIGRLMQSGNRLGCRMWSERFIFCTSTTSHGKKGAF